MKKNWLLIFILALGFFFVIGGGHSLLAATTEGVSLTPDDVPRLITKISTWLYNIFMLLAIVFVLYAGYLYMTGTSENVKTAHKQLMYAAIGIAVALISSGIVDIVTSILKK